MNQEDRPPRDLIDHVLRSYPMLERSAWYLDVRPADERDSRHCTKFGGNKPFRPNNFKWPVCGECGTHKAFVCQINIADLPSLLKEHIKMTSGLFQLFYCLECRPLRCFEHIYIIESSEFVPSLKSLAAEKVGGLKGYKKVLPPTLTNFVAEGTEDIPPAIEMLVVNAYRIVSEMPYFEVCDSNSEIAHEIKRKANFTEEQYQSFLGQLEMNYEMSNANDYLMSCELVKLGGWIFWCHEQAAYLDCPDCGVRMDVTFLQIDDELYQFRSGSEGFWGQLNVMICPQCKRPGLKRW